MCADRRNNRVEIDHPVFFLELETAMLKHIVLREISDHLKSLRFIASFVMIMILFIVSAVFFISEYREQAEDYGRNTAASRAKTTELARQQGGLYRVFSFNYEGPWIFKRPNRLAFIAEGHDRDLPNAFQPSAFRVYGPSKRVRSNMLLWRDEALDWSLIVGIVLSFVSLVFMYDAVSGDRENGTLRLNLSNSVSRTTLLLGKFAGAFLCLASTMFIGMTLGVLIMMIPGKVGFEGLDFITMAGAGILSTLCIAVFLVIGLFISSITRESATSLVAGLLCWAVLVVIIPRSGGFAAKRLIELPTWGKAESEAYRVQNETTERYNKLHPEIARAGMSGHWSPGEPLGRALEASDAWTRSFDEYRNRMIRQVELARQATLFSPYSAYLAGMEALNSSGIVHYRRFFQQTQTFRLAQRQALLDLYPLPLNEFGRSTPEFMKTLEPLDPEKAPIFEEKTAPVATVLNSALPFLLLLALFWTVFFGGALASFLRYDVR
jgi:ABC-type transport system involved in multi-copper enzyme maturation permease subunit